MANRYARPVATGTGSGLSWADASTLSTAITDAAPGDTIYAVRGSYTDTLRRDLKGIQFFGSFDDVSPEASPGLRDLSDIANLSLLIGPTGTASTSNMIGDESAGTSPLFDGWRFLAGSRVVTQANASSSISFRGCVITDSYPASGSPAPASLISATAGLVALESCLLVDVSGVNTIYCAGSGAVTVRGCTVARHDSGDSDWFRVLGGSVTVTDSILWSEDGSTPLTNYAGLTVSSSIVKSGYSGSGSGNLTSDPMFVDYAGGDFALLAGSPAISLASTGTIPATDILGITRSPTAPSSGAFEYQAPAATTIAVSALDASPTVFGPTLALQAPSSLSVGFVDAAPAVLGLAVDLQSSQTVPVGVVDATPAVSGPTLATVPSGSKYASPSGTGSFSGLDWDNAVAFVNHSGVCSSGDTLYMAGGTYTRTGTDAAGAFIPVDGVTYEGDYDPALTGTDLSTRSRILYPTILDGQSARVCLAFTTGQTVVWNGGTFLNGRHIDSGDRIGGGVYMLNGGSFTGRNIDFDACGARWGGGIIGMESASTTCTMVLESCQLRRSVRIQFDGVGDIQLHGAAGGDLTLRNCTVYTSHAGDAFNYALDVTDSADVAVVENTILWADGGATENFGILDESGGSASITVSYSVVAGWAGGGTGNLTSDPEFTSRPGDLSLLSTSPAIDAGDGTLAPTLDYLGNARVDDTGTSNTGAGTPVYTDIGAFEYQTPAATTIAVSALDASPTVFGPTLALQAPSSLSVGFVDAAPAVLGPTVTLALIESGAVVSGTATTAAGAALVVNVVSAGVVDAAAVVLGPSVATQPLQSVALSSVAAATTVPGPAVATGPALTIALSPVDASTAVLGPTVSLTSTGSIALSAVDASAAVLGPTIAAQSPQTIAAGVVDAAPVVLGPAVAVDSPLALAASTVDVAATVLGPTVANYIPGGIALSPVDASATVLGVDLAAQAEQGIAIGTVDAPTAVLGPALTTGSPQAIALSSIDASATVLGLRVGSDLALDISTMDASAVVLGPVLTLVASVSISDISPAPLTRRDLTPVILRDA